MPSTLAALPKGHEFPPATFTLSPEWVAAYIDAVADTAIANVGADLVPPMAVAALSIRALIEASPLPPGALHAGQELSFQRSVRIGEELTVAARIASRGERAGWILMSVDFEVVGQGPSPDSSSRDLIMSARGTITFPVES